MIRDIEFSYQKNRAWVYIVLIFMVFHWGVKAAPASAPDDRGPSPVSPLHRSVVIAGNNGDTLVSAYDLPKGLVVGTRDVVQALNGSILHQCDAEDPQADSGRPQNHNNKHPGPGIENTHQLLFDETEARLPAIVDGSTDAEFGDVDADGDLDLVVTNTDGRRNRLFINDGTGIFQDESAVRLPVDSDFSLAAAFGDFDSDGDLDLFVANNFAFQLPGCALISGQNRLYLNNGQGLFFDMTDSRLPGSIAASTDGRAVDIDADEDLDIVVANCIRPGDCLFLGGGQLQVLVNDGRGFFSDETAERLPPGYHADVCLEPGDVDGDGDLDLMIADPYDRGRLLINDGYGHFADQSSTRLAGRTGSTRDLVLFDAEGDGDLDLFCANDSSAVRSGQAGAQNRLLVNNGSGVFVDETETRLPVCLDVSQGGADAGDVDGDGDADIIVANNYMMSQGRQNHLLLNGGSGYWGDLIPPFLPVIQDVSSDVELVDVTGDGVLDAFVANYREQSLLLIGRKEPRGGPAEPDVLLGDVTLDGRIDILDVLAVVNHILHWASLDDRGWYRADSDGDGEITIMDAVCLVNVILGHDGCSAGEGKTAVTPEVLAFFRSLEASIPDRDFSMLLALLLAESSVPLEFELLQNYPNPFNPETSIRYCLPQAAQVRVELYNALGQIVDVLFEGDTSPGYYDLTWNAREMAAGIYFCRLQAQGLPHEHLKSFTATRKLVLMK